MGSRTAPYTADVRRKWMCLLACEVRGRIAERGDQVTWASQGAELGVSGQTVLNAYCEERPAPGIAVLLAATFSLGWSVHLSDGLAVVITSGGTRHGFFNGPARQKASA